MRMPLPATALALSIGTALGSFPPDIGYGVIPRANGNLQNFQGALGGHSADPITFSGDSRRPFKVNENTFTDLTEAVKRSCANQHKACADAANASGSKNGFTVRSCDVQQTSCIAVQGGSGTISIPSSTTAVAVMKGAMGIPHSSDAEFFYFCDP